MNIDQKLNDTQIKPEHIRFGFFQNQSIQKQYKLHHDFFIQNDPSFRTQEAPNPNSAVRLVRHIFESYLTLSQGLKNTQKYLRDYQETIRLVNLRKRIEQAKIQEQKVQKDEKWKQYEGYENNEINYNLEIATPLPMIINRIVLMKYPEQKQTISACINKLKVMVIKAKYIQSTTLKYLNQTYVSRLKDLLTVHMKVRSDRREKTNFRHVATQRHEIIISALRAIKRQFKVIEAKQIYEQKMGPIKYLVDLKILNNGQIKERPIYYVNFTCEQLLHLNKKQIQFPQTLLFCPIVLINNITVKISDTYIQCLHREFNGWEKYQLVMEVYYIGQDEIPIFYSILKEQKNKLEVPFEKLISSKIRKQFSNIQLIVSNIQKIRKSVYQKMLLNWLIKIFDSKKDCLNITIQNKFIVKIRSRYSNQYNVAESKNGIKSEQRPELLADLLLFSAKKSLKQTKKYLKQTLITHLQASLMKILAQKIGSRVSWPLEGGSLGIYYHEYLNERVYPHNQVKYFYNQF